MSDSSFPPFRPHPLLRNAHLQTILGAYLPAPRSYRAKRRELLLKDGDRIVLHDDCPQSWRPGDRTALLMHGLSGSHRSGYMARVATKLNRRGVRTFRKDLRGHGDGVTRARRAVHAGLSQDVAEAVAGAARLCDGSPLTLIAFSMSGNMALKYLGEHAGRLPPQLDSALVVAPPVDLAHCSENLDRGLNAVYDRAFVRRLMKLVQQRNRVFGEWINDPPIARRLRLRQFDTHYTAPLSGFSSVEEYYAQASAAPLLKQVQLETLIITAADDPLIPLEMFRHHSLSPAIKMHVTQRGGHLGFISSSSGDPDRHWLDWRIVDWVANRPAGVKPTKNRPLELTPAAR